MQTIIETTIQVKKELPCLSHVVLIGDRRKFLSCLVTLKLEVDNVLDIIYYVDDRAQPNHRFPYKYQ